MKQMMTRIVHLDFEAFADLNLLAAYSLFANVFLFAGLLATGHPLIAVLCSLLLDTVFVVLSFEAD